MGHIYIDGRLTHGTDRTGQSLDESLERDSYRGPARLAPPLPEPGASRPAPDPSPDPDSIIPLLLADCANRGAYPRFINRPPLTFRTLPDYTPGWTADLYFPTTSTRAVATGPTLGTALAAALTLEPWPQVEPYNPVPHHYTAPPQTAQVAPTRRKLT